MNRTETIYVLVAVAFLAVCVLEFYVRHQRVAIARNQNRLWDLTEETIREKIEDPERMASMVLVRERVGAQKAFLDMICRSVAVALNSPRAVVTMLDDRGQTLLSSHYVDETEPPQVDGRPNTETYCQYVVASDNTLVITNAPKDVRVADNYCTVVLGLRAYLGTPVHSREGFPVGSLCVFDTEVRDWKRRDVVTLESFASLISL